MKYVFRTIVLLVFCALVVWVIVSRPSLPIESASNSRYPVATEALKAHVHFLSVECIPRDHEHTENLNKAANCIKSAFTKSTDRVEFQSYVANGKEYKNVIGIYGPDSDEILIVGAHYDAFSNLPGADDNASGVAGLIELGNLLSSVALQSRILLVAYTLEEPPYFRTTQMGSAIHAQSLVASNTKVKLMISLEMIGYYSDAQNSQDYPNALLRFLYPKQGNYISIIDQLKENNAYAIKQTINSYTEIPAHSINAPAFIPGIDFSDHMNYWKYDYPAVMITDTAFYRNRNYHTAKDSYEKLDYDKMAQVIYGVFKYIETNNT